MEDFRVIGYAHLTRNSEEAMPEKRAPFEGHFSLCPPSGNVP